MSRRAPLKKIAVLVILAALGGTTPGNPRPWSRDLTGQHSRINALLIQLADQARASDDLAFSVRAQAEAATLLWPNDHERARAFFRRAFEALATPDPEKEKADGGTRRILSLSSAARVQLRSELLNQIAARDPELVEELARKLTEPSRDSSSNDGALAPTLGHPDIAQRELLVSVALQIVERDPNRAMTLGQLSLGTGPGDGAAFISPNFARLLTWMRGTDPALAQLLFSSAVDRLERSALSALADIQALSSYLASSQSGSARDLVGRRETERFLRLAFTRIMRYREPSSGAASELRTDRAERLDDKSAIYFLGRQLTELFARYLPERLPQLKTRIAQLTDSAAVARVEVEALGPADIARQARKATDPTQSDSLYARAALMWLSQGEINEAQAMAMRIGAVETRDRVLAQIARQQAAGDHVEDAVAIAKRIEDKNARVGVLVRSAEAALGRNNRVRAGELLNDAESDALKAEPSVERSQALLAVVNSFAAFDIVRAFEVMQSAVKSLNQLMALREDQRQYDLAGPRRGTDYKDAFGAADLYHLGLEGTLRSLARADFDRALLLAQQLNGREAVIIAQLAVCGGGLSLDSAKHQSTGGDESALVANPE